MKRLSMRRLLPVLGLTLAAMLAGCDPDGGQDPGPVCGDEVIDPGEECDGAELGGESCESLGFSEGGTLACTATCELDVSGCLGTRCGDGILDSGEECDGSDLGGATCADLGYHDGGELACAPDCTLDVSRCQGGYCGDGIINGPEMCDGDDMSQVTCNVTCQDYGFYAGELSCNESCTLDPSTCEQHCGDGIMNGPEACDGEDLDGMTCLALGYHEGGVLACSTDCMTMDVTGCQGGYCGDGIINGDEACDEDDLGGLTCQDLGYSWGDLTCAQDCTLDMSGCQDSVCGDGVRAGGEACDGTDLGGATCADVGYYDGGVLGCAGDCTFDVSGCLGGYCGDGIINGPEACDGSDLGGATCEDYGMIDGTLGCSSICEIDTSACLPDWICGDVLVDERDGKTYSTIALGGLCWMATNLDVGVRIDTSVPQANNAQIEKYCYSNDPNMCAQFGGLYQWNEAMQYTQVAGTRGICPERWRLPTDQEWKNLEIAAGMDPLVADQDKWRGPPAGTELRIGGSTGFDAPLGGMVSSTGSSFNYPSYGYYWTSTLGSSMPWRRCFTSGPAYPADTVGRWDTWPQGYALPIRCVTDP